MKIETMTARHLDEVCAIENACFSHPWSRQSLEDALREDNNIFFVAAEHSAVMGYIGMSTVLDEGYVFNVAVAQPYRNKGVGTALIQMLVTYCKKNSFAFLTLEVRESNTPAISLYSKFGFIKVGERKDYYTDPKESAVLMTLFF